MPLKIFIDFDGTITRQDVGNAFFVEFGGGVCSEYVAEYKTGQISAKELFRKEVAAIGLLDERKAVEWFHDQPLDESFGRFVDFCRQRKILLKLIDQIVVLIGIFIFY